MTCVDDRGSVEFCTTQTLRVQIAAKWTKTFDWMLMCLSHLCLSSSPAVVLPDIVLCSDLQLRFSNSAAGEPRNAVAQSQMFGTRTVAFEEQRRRSCSLLSRCQRKQRPWNRQHTCPLCFPQKLPAVEVIRFCGSNISVAPYARVWTEPTVLWNSTNANLLEGQERNETVWVPAVGKGTSLAGFVLLTFFFKPILKSTRSIGLKLNSWREEAASAHVSHWLSLNKQALHICLSVFQQGSFCTLIIFGLTRRESVWNVQSCPQ